MKISELIEHLESCKEQFGDKIVFHRELIFCDGELIAPQVEPDDIDYYQGSSDVEEGIYI